MVKKFVGCKAIDPSREAYISIAESYDNLSPDCLAGTIFDVEARTEPEAIRKYGNKLLSHQLVEDEMFVNVGGVIKTINETRPRGKKIEVPLDREVGQAIKDLHGDMTRDFLSHINEIEGLVSKRLRMDVPHP